MSENWHRNMALRLGAGGVIEYTAARVGQTLHVPCARGHTCDFYVEKRMPPEAVVRKMLRAGWTVGNKIVCPEHATAKHERVKPTSISQCGTEVRPPAVAAPKRHTHGALKRSVLEALEQLGPLSVEDLVGLTGSKNGTIHKTLSDFVTEGKVTKEPQGKKHIYRLAGSQKEENMESTVTPITAAKAPSPTGLAARRAAVEWLVESFDAEGGRYKAGISDATIAKETGLAEVAVAAIREENFGPLKEPNEIADARAMLNTIEQRVATLERDATASIQQLRDALEAHRNRLGALISKNGWKHP